MIIICSCSGYWRFFFVAIVRGSFGEVSEEKKAVAFWSYGVVTANAIMNCATNTKES